MLKTLGLSPFSLPRKTTVKLVLALKAKPLFGFTKRCAPAEANQHWREKGVKVLPFVSLVGGSNPFETYADAKLDHFPK